MMGQQDEKKEDSEARDVLLSNELLLARANYEGEDDRYKLLADKAKITFTVAGIIGAFGLSKADSFVPTMISAGIAKSVFAFAVLGLSYFLFAYAIVVSLRILATRKLASLSRSNEYAESLNGRDKDTINRSLSNIYQEAADSYHDENDSIARQVNRAMTAVTYAFLSALLFWVLYGCAAWDGCVQSAAVGASAAQPTLTIKTDIPTQLEIANPSDGKYPSGKDKGATTPLPNAVPVPRIILQMSVSPPSEGRGTTTKDHKEEKDGK